MNCLWNMGTSCVGNVSQRLIFKAQLDVPICDRHYNEHLIILLLIEKSVKHVDIHDSTAEQRNKMLDGLLGSETLNDALRRKSEEDSKK